MESSSVANHVVALVKGVTTSQTIDMAVVLQVSPTFALLQALLYLLGNPECPPCRTSHSSSGL